MEKGFQRQATPEQMEKIKAQVTRLSVSEDDCQHAMQMITDILESTDNTFTVDANDIRDSLNVDGTLSAFDISVCATNIERMSELQPNQ